jgi:two-component system response regulator NreC
MPALRILVVDDHELVRKGVCATLGARKDLQVIGEAADGKEAIVKTAALHPDLVVMDVSMPGMDGVSAAREILKQHPQLAIIILSMHNTKQLIEGARQVGVRGYVSKSQVGSTLLDAIDLVMQHQDFFPDPTPPSVTKSC